MKSILGVVVIILAAEAAHGGPVDDLVARAATHRAAGRFNEAIALLREAKAKDARRLDVHRLLAETLAWNKQFALAAAEYEAALAKWPSDRALRIRFAQVLLWKGDFRRGERMFVRVLNEAPADKDAILGAAQGAYWSGDYRRALERFQRALRQDPNNEEAVQAVTALRALMATRYEVTGAYATDTQPLRRNGVNARVSHFTDALTRWDFRGGAGSIADERLDGELEIRSLGASGTTTLPALRTTLSLGVDRLWFSDGDAENLVSASVSWKHGNDIAAVSFDQLPLVGTLSSIRQRAIGSRTSLAFHHQPEDRWQASATAHIVDYSDGNRGSGADAYVLIPLLRRWGVKTQGGFSAAWRDTDENRFRFTGFTATQRGLNDYAYSFTGVYDPYWTPHDLGEARLIGAVEFNMGRWHARLQGDGGYARERARAFAPPDGATPTPPATFPIMLARTYQPWRASAQVRFVFNPQIEIRARYRHEVTAFYNVNEFEASLGGRL